MQLDNPKAVMNHLIALLAAEGIEAFIGKVPVDYQDGEYEDGLRVPAWENEEQELCRDAVDKFILNKLAANPRKGFKAEMPGVEDTLNVYSINPSKVDDGGELNYWDVMVWSAGESLDSFSWEESVRGCDSAWWEGWDIPDGFGLLSKRIANLLILLHNELVDLPPVQPYTEAELIEKLEGSCGLAEMNCDGGSINDHWNLRLSPEGSLVMHKRSDGSLTPITSEHINDKGGVVLDGRTIIHRSWGY